jgi:SET domain-containing protein
MILSCLFIGPTKDMGRGVFTSENLEKDIVIEISPVIIMSADERKIIDQTTLHDYIFEWGQQRKQCCMALGYVSVYNHSYKSNCEYVMDFDAGTITISTVRNINEGEELFINYNGNWNDGKKIWFETK